MMHALELTRDPGWVLTHEGYDVLSENAVESSFAYGNGLLGTRASRPVSRGPTMGQLLGYIRWANGRAHRSDHRKTGRGRDAGVVNLGCYPDSNAVMPGATQ